MTTSDGLKRKTFVASLWSFLRSGWNAVATFILFAVMARLLGPADFGVFALASLLVEIARIVSSVGLADAVIREPDLSDRFASTVFWGVTGLSVAAAAAVFVAAPFYADLVGTSEVVPVIQALALMLPVSTSAVVPAALLTRDFQYRQMTLRGIVANLLGGAAAIGLALTGWGVWALVGQFLVTSLLGSVLTWQISPWRPKLMFDPRLVRRLLVFSGSIMATHILWMLLARVQEIFISRWHGTEAVGQYRIAWRLIELVAQTLLSPIGSVTLVTFSHVQGDLPRLQAIYGRMVGLAATAALPCLLGIGAVAPLLLPLLFGEKWAASAPVAEVLVLMCVPFVLNFFAGPALTAVNRPQSALQVALLQLLLTVAFTWLAVRHGLVAVAAAYVLRAWITMLPQQVALRRHTGVRMRRTGAAVLPPLLAAMLMALIVRASAGPLVDRMGAGWSTALSQVAIGVVAFLATMMLIGHDPRRELRDLLTTLRPRKEIG